MPKQCYHRIRQSRLKFKRSTSISTHFERLSERKIKKKFNITKIEGGVAEESSDMVEWKF